MRNLLRFKRTVSNDAGVASSEFAFLALFFCVFSVSALGPIADGARSGFSLSFGGGSGSTMVGDDNIDGDWNEIRQGNQLQGLGDHQNTIGTKPVHSPSDSL